ncbi:patatin-like phospholipase family protein [Bradyrhizobium canariense]|uniref:Patatin n=1 Tax=Bradyrhizobium canariense TaxID=255045 RepID=A0A1X3GN41_9BRAD|nr:patatin-like phospholipase family protein [Bradyrhizobium canariense]OSI68581.1 patatin [Bradyrhizobium canariense]OSI78029.1 patatin [Bradyrhizobium canariense]OSI89259.1 patatin [Bradyrhizobium canariense]OSI93741.1 patatin [Bradyrhizobium canariense]OSJ03058.1 patatin [Bradyrhizobium canariense]
MRLEDRLIVRGQRKLLAIDGGGIRGVLALEILGRIEAELRAKSGDKDLRLANYFDFIGGTSTGAIVAAGLAKGMEVREILDFYIRCGADMFTRAGLVQRLRYSYEDEPLAAKLREVFGKSTELGSDELRSLLLIVLRNATTDSPWPIWNNPFAKYNEASRADCNLRLPLWQLVRASTAAPTYFPPEVISTGRRDFIFVDGGVTTYNNPAFQMFLMSTVDRFWPGAPEGRGPWLAGEDKMLIVSVGTGTSPGANERLRPQDMNLLFNAGAVPSALMFAALNEQDFLCRVFGKCLAGDPLDREVQDMIGSKGPLSDGQKLFSYVRYNAELTETGLTSIGCGNIDPRNVQKLDSFAAVEELRRIGSEVGKLKVMASHFDGFI